MSKIATYTFALSIVLFLSACSTTDKKETNYWASVSSGVSKVVKDK